MSGPQVRIPGADAPAEYTQEDVEMGGRGDGGEEEDGEEEAEGGAAEVRPSAPRLTFVE